MSSVRPVIKWPGSKAGLAGWISGLLPPTRTYLEPFAGSACVLLARQRSPIEVLNDQDSDITNLFRVLRRPETREQLIDQITYSLWSREDYQESLCRAGEPVEDARRFLVRCWQGYGCRTLTAPGWRRQIGKSKSGGSGPTTWKRLPDRIRETAARIQDAHIEHRCAFHLLADYAHAHVAIYADPPYHPDVLQDDRLYRHVLTREQHQQLLHALDRHPGPVALSGYAHPDYDQALRSWTRLDRPSLADGAIPRMESLWLNPNAARFIR